MYKKSDFQIGDKLYRIHTDRFTKGWGIKEHKITKRCTNFTAMYPEGNCLWNS